MKKTKHLNDKVSSNLFINSPLCYKCNVNPPTLFNEHCGHI